LGFEKATWTGNTQGISPDLIKAFFQAGLIPLIALSGQHVGAFSFVIFVFFKVFSLILWRIRFCRGGIIINKIQLGLRRAVPCLGAFFLWLTSGGQTCMERVLVMSVILYGISLRGFYLTSQRLVASTLSLVLLWSPEKIGNLSFILSIVATALLVNLMQRKLAFSTYVQTSLLMPIFMFPLLAHYQAKWAVTASIYSLLLGGIWDVIILPVGFCLPWVIFLTPKMFRAPLLNFLEKIWLQFQKGLILFFENFEPSYVSCYRPTFWETILCLILILLILKEITKAQRDAAGKL
jgi:predicted membrane metal-binding protein